MKLETSIFAAGAAMSVGLILPAVIDVLHWVLKAMRVREPVARSIAFVGGLMLAAGVAALMLLVAFVYG